MKKAVLALLLVALAAFGKSLAIQLSVKLCKSLR